MAEITRKQQEQITEQGNPSRPQGEAGAEMLARMNESHAEVTEWALSYFDWRGDEQVLDIGCGGGATLQRMSAHIGAEGHLTGLDYSEVSVAESRAFNAAEIESGHMDVLTGSVENLPFAADSFNKITTVESFYFWPDPAENLKEVRRVLKAGGTFLLIADIYNHEGLSPKTKENIAKYEMFNPTLTEYQQLFEQAGFVEVQIHTQTGEDWVCVEGRK
jgi:SAM-dependent methyltransferase